jgi:hypothetical protein
MAEKSAYLSADEFLAAISGGTIDHELMVDGRAVGKVQIRSLELAEVQDAIASFKGNSGGLTLWTLDNALVNPALSDAQREQVRKGKPGPLLNLAKHIMETSGMTDTVSGVPLDGDGLPTE